MVSYPSQKRLQVIVTYLNTLSVANTSRICRVSYNCVDKYIRFFQQKATFNNSCNQRQCQPKENGMVEGGILGSPG